MDSPYLMEILKMTKFISYDNLSFFLSKLQTIFSNIGHTHTVDNISGLSDTISNIQSDVDTLEQTVADLDENTNNNKLPTVSSNNDGSLLMVVNGVWSIATIPNAEEASF